MKIFLISFLLFLVFVAPNIKEDVDISQSFRDGFYDYLTSLDKAVDYANENIPFISKITNMSYNKIYKKVMEDRFLTKHLVSSGETLDYIIKKYNSSISDNDLEDFRKVVYKENIDVVSEDYSIQSGKYILVPKE